MCQELKARSCGGGGMVSAMWLALGERRARALGVSEPRGAGAIGAAGAGAAVCAAAETGEAGRAGQPLGQGQAAALAQAVVASEPEEQLMTKLMEQQLAQAAERQMRAARRRRRPAAQAAGGFGGNGSWSRWKGWEAAGRGG